MIIIIKQKLSVWLIKKIQKYCSHEVHVLGRTYKISEHVFNPSYFYTSEFMARHIHLNHDDIVLDMGTGSGIQAITAGCCVSRVIAVDRNPEAVRCAKENIRAHGMEDRIAVIEGDLFSPFRKNCFFNVILFTPPYMEGHVKTDFDYALFDPGKALLKRFFREARDVITPDGYVQMLYSSIAHPEEALRIAERNGWSSEVIASEKTMMERFYIYKLTLLT